MPGEIEGGGGGVRKSEEGRDTKSKIREEEAREDRKEWEGENV